MTFYSPVPFFAPRFRIIAIAACVVIEYPFLTRAADTKSRGNWGNILIRNQINPELILKNGPEQKVPLIRFLYFLIILSAAKANTTEIRSLVYEPPSSLIIQPKIIKRLLNQSFTRIFGISFYKCENIPKKVSKANKMVKQTHKYLKYKDYNPEKSDKQTCAAFYTAII